MSHIKSDGLSLEDFYDLEFVDDDEDGEKKKSKKKKKKHNKNKNKKKDKSYIKSSKKGKKKKYKKSQSFASRLLDSVDVNLDSEIKISITDETINRAINAGIGIVNMFRNRKKNTNDNKVPELTEVASSSTDDK